MQNYDQDDIVENLYYIIIILIYLYHENLYYPFAYFRHFGKKKAKKVTQTF